MKSNNNGQDEAAALERARSNFGKKRIPYSIYFEVRLDPSDFGKKRAEHYAICNTSFLKTLREYKDSGHKFYNEFGIDDLIEEITKSPKKPPENFRWEHCSTSKIHDRQEGVMHLVLLSQHNPESDFWRALHPDYGTCGGYHEWAVPNGAPIDKTVKGQTVGKWTKRIPDLELEELSECFLKAVQFNRHREFKNLIERAQQLSVTEQELKAMLTKPYSIGPKGKLNNLLHISMVNGYVPFIQTVMSYFKDIPNFLQLINHKGNTLAHVAVENNRYEAIKMLKALDVDLNIRNKAKKTVFDIAKHQNFKSCMPAHFNSTMNIILHNDESTDSSDSIADKEQERSTISDRDPTFTYAGLMNKKNGSFSNSVLKVKIRKPSSAASSAKQNSSRNNTFKDIIKKQTHEKVADNSMSKKSSFKKSVESVVSIPEAQDTKKIIVVKKEAKSADVRFFYQKKLEPSTVSSKTSNGISQKQKRSQIIQQQIQQVQCQPQHVQKAQRQPQQQIQRQTQQIQRQQQQTQQAQRQPQQQIQRQTQQVQRQQQQVQQAQRQQQMQQQMQQAQRQLQMQQQQRQQQMQQQQRQQQMQQQQRQQQMQQQQRQQQMQQQQRQQQMQRQQQQAAAQRAAAQAAQRAAAQAAQRAAVVQAAQRAAAVQAAQRAAAVQAAQRAAAVQTAQRAMRR